jgi:hypothetical protein
MGQKQDILYVHIDYVFPHVRIDYVFTDPQSLLFNSDRRGVSVPVFRPTF